MNLSALLRNAIAKPAAPQPRGGIYLGWGSEGPVLARPDEHLLVIGPPRSGKTTRLLAFSVLCHSGAVVATSTKPDFIGLTSWARGRLGRIWFWASVLSWLHRHQLLAPITVLKDYGSERAAELLEGIARTEARERSGIFSTADGKLSAYRTNAALRAASAPNFDPTAFAASTDTIYLCAPSTAQALHAPLVVALLDQIRGAIYKSAPPAPRCCSHWTSWPK